MPAKAPHPKTLDEAMAITRKHEEDTGVALETVPNPDEGIYFNVVERTVTRLAWDAAGNIIEVISSADTGDIVKRRKVLDAKVIAKANANTAKILRGQPASGATGSKKGGTRASRARPRKSRR